MRWFHELLWPAALLVTVAAFWVAAEAKSLEQRASRPSPPADPELSREVLQTYGYPACDQFPMDHAPRAARAPRG